MISSLTPFSAIAASWSRIRNAPMWPESRDSRTNRDSVSQAGAGARWVGKEAEMSFFQRLFTARASRTTHHDVSHAEVIKHTAEMVRDGGARSLARKHE